MRASRSCSVPPWQKQSRARSPRRGPRRARKPNRSRALHEAVVEGVTGAANGADRGGGGAAIERFAQASDMDVDGALVDVDVPAPDTVEQLLARKHPARVLHQEFEQAEFGRPERNVAAGARHPLLLA